MIHYGKTPPRARDEIILAMIAARIAGVSVSGIARANRTNRGAVYKVINSVIRADLDESGEDPETIRAAYQ